MYTKERESDYSDPVAYSRMYLIHLGHCDFSEWKVKTKLLNEAQVGSV